LEQKQQSRPEPDELDAIERGSAGPGVVQLASHAIMENVRDVAGRTSAHAEHSSYRQSSGFVPGEVETIDMNNPTDLDQQLGFPAHSVIVDNPTKRWIFVHAAQRFACPGLTNAVWQIPKAATKAQAAWRAPFGAVQPAIGTATQATLTFCEAWLMPTPGIISNAAGI
jgi:hypothetical protein